MVHKRTLVASRGTVTFRLYYQQWLGKLAPFSVRVELSASIAAKTFEDYPNWVALDGNINRVTERIWRLIREGRSAADNRRVGKHRAITATT